MEAYRMTKRQTLDALQATEGGLSSAEAARRLARHGKNVLEEGKRRGIIALFFAQFHDLMTIILLCAAALSGLLAYLTRDLSELADTGILLAVILLNAFAGVLQQYRADSAIRKLKQLSVATARAVRDGRVCVLPAEDLVPGDIVEVEEGDRIPADLRILACEGLRCDESALTGESRPAGKRDTLLQRAPLAERENMLYSSTYCVGGRARCVVTATGMHTEVGAIAGLLHEAAPQPSPLDKTLARLSRVITITVLSVAAVLFVGGLIAGRVSFLDNLMTAIALSVAAIPEGMGAVVTIILAMGVQRMAAAHAVVRKLRAVETLGSCSCICSDKTGTLTQNRMTVAAVAGQTARVLRCMRICNSVKRGTGGYVGDPTEIALVEYAAARGKTEFSPLAGIPFSSERRRMSVAARTDEGEALFVKGGTDTILARCSRIAAAGGDRAMTAEDREVIVRQMRAWSAQAMRVLAFAEGDYRGKIEEDGLTFLGMAALYDPPKEGAKEAVAACAQAGVRTVMITGDGADTAFAIARRLGIASDRGEVLTGEELDDMGDGFESRARSCSVFARVTPRHKLDIVRALQGGGEVVAMTGDGVNDAPALRAADIGIAMGDGADVTKDAADMVLADNDFSTIVRAVKEGRGVFYNVKRTVSFFLSTNLAEVFAVLIATLFLWRYDFLTSTQLLWINLITDSLPVFALGAERTQGVMQRPPVSADGIFRPRSLLFMLVFGILQTAIVIGVFVFATLRWGNAVGSTCAFLTLSLLELFHAFNVCKERGRMRLKELFARRALLCTVLVGIVLNALLVLLPFARGLFDLSALSLSQWALVLLSSAAIVPLGELYKCTDLLATELIRRRKRRIPLRGSAR